MKVVSSSPRDRRDPAGLPVAKTECEEWL